MTSIKSYYTEIPGPVRTFLLRGLLIFIAWKLVYLGFLLPGRVIDAPLSELTGFLAAKLLSLGTNASSIVSDDRVLIFVNGVRAARIADGCNGLVLFVIHLGFIISFPSTLSRKIVFALGGLALILFLNIVRCAMLSVINREYLALVDHHFVFNLIVYALLFLIWHINVRLSTDATS